MAAAFGVAAPAWTGYYAEAMSEASNMMLLSAGWH